MNNTVYYDSGASDEVRRQHLYDGQLFVYSPRRSILEFVDFARGMIEDAFGDFDPRIAQDGMDVESYADLLGKLKPAFIHHPSRSGICQRSLRISAATWRRPTSTCRGCGVRRAATISPPASPMPGTRIATPGTRRRPARSTGGCRSTSSNSDNAMAFHPRYWSEPVKNSSAGYNYYTWNKLHRGENVAKLVKEDPRPLPRATEPMELDPQIRLICPVGGLILFSAAQMHSSVPNTSGVTRFSIDFRTVHLDDVVERAGRAQYRRGLHRHGHARLHARHRFRAAAGRRRRALRRRHRHCKAS